MCLVFSINLLSIVYVFNLLEMEHVEQDPDFIVLSRRFKATAMELISILEQVKIRYSSFGI